MYLKYFKRLFDVNISIGLFLVLLPVLLMAVVINFIIYGKHLFFVQKRVGKGEELFELYKFRTLLPAKKHTDDTIIDPVTKESVRITLWGKILRNSGLDEIPQLWNVIKDDISLIGPRPLLPEYLDYYSLQEKQRHDIKPGLTGWAQIHGRNELAWDSRLSLDVYYVHNRSLMLDLKILQTTAKQVFDQRDNQLGTSLVDFRNGLKRPC